MQTYRICDMALASNIPLPELIPLASSGAECRFQLMAPGQPLPGNITWFRQWLINQDDQDDLQNDGKVPWACFGRSDDDYVLRFPSFGDFLLSEDLQDSVPPFAGHP